MIASSRKAKHHADAVNSNPGEAIGWDSSEAGHSAAVAVCRPVLSLFSGAGGLDLGFQRAGFQPVIAIDINPAAVETYQNNHPGTLPQWSWTFQPHPRRT